jgi:hypothetical protein
MSRGKEKTNKEYRTSSQREPPPLLALPRVAGRYDSSEKKNRSLGTPKHPAMHRPMITADARHTGDITNPSPYKARKSRPLKNCQLSSFRKGGKLHKK